jgi:hypothetical protein
MKTAVSFMYFATWTTCAISMIYATKKWKKVNPCQELLRMSRVDYGAFTFDG